MTRGKTTIQQMYIGLCIINPTSRAERLISLLMYMSNFFIMIKKTPQPLLLRGITRGERALNSFDRWSLNNRSLIVYQQSMPPQALVLDLRTIGAYHQHHMCLPSTHQYKILREFYFCHYSTTNTPLGNSPPLEGLGEVLLL